jgi:hypothetical protein
VTNEVVRCLCAFSLRQLHSFDLRLLREYYFKVGGRTNTLQFGMDFINVGNMLNSEWGVEKQQYLW